MIKSVNRWSRRRFVATGVAAGALAYQPLARAQAPQRKVLHLIGHSHIDAAWLWPWRDGSNVVLNTMRSALDRMTETPGFRYTHSSVQHYRWLQEAYPEMFAEVKQRIAEGRWEVAGGWPVEPDCNIPSTESFVRHCLYGKRFCQSMLGVNVEIGFNPDSFGHAAGLPTVLRHAGYKWYVFMRPREMETDLPRLFWWEGPDGSRVLTLHIWDSYDKNASQIASALPHVFAPGFEHGAFFFGVGDHGGAVTKAQIQAIEQMRSDATLPELRWSTVREFFDAVAASPAMAALPVVRGSLEHHARGCYSANGEEKYNNRRAERALVTTESISLFANLRDGVPYPGQKLAGAWERVLFNQFHDVLAGSALYSDYEQARDGIGLACEVAEEEKISRLEEIAKKVDLSDVPEGAIFAYNALPWARRALLEYIPSGYDIKDPITHLIAPDGSEIPVQARSPRSMSVIYPRIAAVIELPACGYRVYQAVRGAQAKSPAPTPWHFDLPTTAGGVAKLLSTNGTELLAAPVGLVVIEDKSDTWAHDIISFNTEIGRPTWVSAEIVEDGPALRVQRQHFRWRQSTITVELTELRGSRVLELHFVIDWQEKEQILKLEIPTAFSQSRVFAKVAGAIAETKPGAGEEPGQDWIAIQGSVDGHVETVALVNAQTYSYDCVDSRLRTVLVRSAPYARHDPTPVNDNGMNAWLDQGRQERRFWLYSGEGEVLDQNLDRLAEELQTQFEYVIDSRHSGHLPKEQSFLQVRPETVSVLSIKQSEDGEAVILRMQERVGKTTRVKMGFALLGLEQEISFAPWQIKTIRLRGKELSEVSGLEV